MAIDFETQLKDLAPGFMQRSQRFLDFLAEAGKILDEIQAKVAGLAEFNPDEISADYIQHLADKLGYQIKRSGAGLTYTEAELRRLLKAIPVLYSLKGEKRGFEALIWYYYSISIISILELWTNDYASFKPYLAVGDVELRDGGDWYISPHVLFTFPTTIFTTLGALVGGGEQEGKTVFTEILERLSEFRPTHVVVKWALEHSSTSMGTMTLAPGHHSCIFQDLAASRSWS